jgi:hypothetical protein
MQYVLAASVLIIAAVLYGRWRSATHLTQYLLSVKPALRGLGFVGSEGDVTEGEDAIDVLYYLHDFDILCKSGIRLSERLKSLRTSIVPRDWEKDEAEPAFRYAITFRGTLFGGRSLGVLQLNVQACDDDGRYGELGTDFTKVIAPLLHFNDTNLRTYIERILMDIEVNERGTPPSTYWYVQGLKLAESEARPVSVGLPFVDMGPDQASTATSRRAAKRLDDGYPA